MTPSLLNKSIAFMLLVLVFCAAQGQSGILDDAFTVAFDKLLSESRGLLALKDHSFIAEKFEQWMAKHGRSYNSITERVNRFYIFKDNYEYIENFNKAENKTYKLGINEFSDLTSDEFLAMYTGNIDNIPDISGPLETTSEYESRRSLASVPSSINWVEKGAVTPVKNQGSCGSCWTFSVIAATEGILQIKTGKLLTLSEQQILDCNYEGYGCGGGTTNAGFDYIVGNKGIAYSTTYPYKGTKLTCQTYKTKQIAAQIRGYKILPSYNEGALQQAVAQQPVSIILNSRSIGGIQHYRSGVFTGPCATSPDHAVTAVGYGTSEDGIKYWLIKNSWGTTWGERGYIRMQRDVSDRRGLCGLASFSTYPVY